MKKTIISFWLIILIFITIITPINIDTVYNFVFAHNIKNGLVPYLDFNMIITPLCAYITSFLLIFYDKIIVVNFLLIPIAMLIYYFLYKICNIFKIPVLLNLILNGVFSLFVTFISGFNYNLYIVICWEVLVYLFLKINSSKNVTFKNIIFISAVCVISILFKQTNGVIFFISSFIGLFILLYKYNKNKILKILLMFLSFNVIGLFPFIIYLFATGSFYDFIEQTILGVSSFSSDFKFVSIETIVAYLTIIGLLTLYLYNKKHDFNFIILSLFSIIQINVVYPLANTSHFICGIVGLLIMIQVFLYDFLKKYYSVIIIVCSIFLYCGFIFYNVHSILKTDYVFSKQKYFTGCLIEKNIENNIDLLTEYMEQYNDKKYYIITDNPSMFKLNFDLYDKYYDLFYMGNIGRNDSIDLIKKVDNQYIVVCTNSDDDFFQIDKKVLEYIRSLNKIDEVGDYTIYSK